MSEIFTTFNAQVLALIAWADGKFDENEERLYLAIIESSTKSEELKSELMKYIDSPPDLNELLQKIPEIPTMTVANTLRDAYIISMADKSLHNNEKKIIYAIAKKLGVSDDKLPKVYEMMVKYHDSFKIEEELFYYS